MCSLDKVGFLKKETWLPVALTLFIEKENLIEEFKLYLAIKLSCSGKIKPNSMSFKGLRAQLNICSRTTFNKRIKALREMNWLGYSENTGYYFIRGIERICNDLNIGFCQDLNIDIKTCVKFEISYFNNFRVFVFAAIICCKINHIKYAKQRNRKGNRSVQKYRDNSTNPNLSPSVLDYHGLSVSYIAKLIGKSESRCSELRKSADEAGFLHNIQKKQVIDIFPKNPYIRSALMELYPDRYHKFITTIIKKGENRGKVQVLEQLENEIIPLLKFRKK
jgi:hypothetical protein